ncbi:hypothetical protein V6N13_128841 [Hibiscus sabdariffa]|uniref:Agglutinin domain-containing protein n=2 Tax=Hibiscus sabdariffa TaxID=183260 RepID=A0ABR2ACF5_9ROSI
MEPTLPRFIVIETVDRIGYLSYIREGGEADGFMRFMEPKVTAPYAKFEVESSETEGLVHIRSCQNNKYWQRMNIPHVPWGHWIATGSKEKEEDRSKEWCTLFEFIPVDPAKNKFRIMHVQSDRYLCSPLMDDPKFDHGLLSYHKEFDYQNADVFTIIDWSSLLILPKHVVFKGDNDKYMYLYRDTLPYFGTYDIGVPTAAFEILPTNDGNIRIKCSKTGKFFRCENSKWIHVDKTSADNPDTIFRPVKIDDQKIALISLSNNNFCKRLSDDGYGDALAADITSATKETQLTVEEPVLTREIYDIKYDVLNSRVHAESVHVLAHGSLTNITDQPSTMDIKLEYKETRTSSWKTDLSLKLRMKTTMKFDVPLVSKGGIEFSAEVQSGVEWGKVFETTTNREVVHKVAVPPMSMVTVNLVATKGLCDVPFRYKQRDTLYDGSSVTSAVQGGTYFGSNYHSMKYEVRAEKLPPGSTQ